MPHVMKYWFVSCGDIFRVCIWFDLMQSWEVSMAKHENTSSGLNASKPQCMETEKEHKKHLIRWNQKHKPGIQSFPC